MGKVKYILLLVLIGCLLCQCVIFVKQDTRICIKNDKEHKIAIPNENWWNYYERGLTFSEKGCFEEAIEDFEQAVKQRYEDQREARIYGMNFIDYFPHREIGVVYCQLGYTDAAHKKLELSLTQFPSAKTLFYLEKVGNILNKRSGFKISQPEIVLDIEGDFWTRNNDIDFKGNIKDEQYIAFVSVEGEPEFILNNPDDLKKTVPINNELNLSHGQHSIEVKAKNIYGGMSSRTIVIHVDQKGPEIIIENLDVQYNEVGNKAVVMNGFLEDDAGVSEFFINKRKIPVRQDIKIHFKETVETDTDTLELEAFDSLRNSRRKEISLPSFISSYRPVLLAANSNSFFRVADSEDSRPPKIKIKNLDDNSTVFQENIVIDMEIDDDTYIEAIWINNIPVYRRKAMSISFSQIIKLREGSNIIVARAKDIAGNEAKKKITVIRKVPEAFRMENRMSLSVLFFKDDRRTASISKEYHRFLIRALAKQSRFQIFSIEGVQNNVTDAQYNITGSINDKSNQGIGVTCEIVDAKTGRIIAFTDVYDEVNNIDDLKSLAEGMANKIHQEFPLVSGKVLYKEGKEIFTDIAHPNLKIGTRLIVHREDEKVISGRTIVYSKIIGYARITDISPELTKALLQDCNPDEIRLHDKVITE